MRTYDTYPRGDTLDPDTLIDGPLHNPEARWLVEQYLQTYPETQTLPSLNSLRLARTDYFFNIDTAHEAAASIGIPSDIDDDPLAISETLSLLSKASNTEKYEIVLGVNGAWPGWGAGAGVEIARQQDQYDSLVAHLHAVKGDLFPRIQLRTFLTHIQDRTMNKVWSKILQSIIIDSIIINRKSDHPVLRFDSDSTGISNTAPEAMVEAIRTNQAHLVKVPTSFSNRNKTTKRTAEYSFNLMDPAERQADVVATIYAYTKEMIETQLPPGTPRTYDEESGSGAKLATWMRVMMIARQNDPEQQSTDGENKIFLRIAKTALDQTIAPLLYIDPSEALHHTSRRRQKKLAAQLPPWQLPLAEEGDDYKTYIEMSQEKTTELRPQLRTLQDVMAMIGIMILRQEAVSRQPIHFPPSTRKAIASLVNTGRFRPNGRPLDTYFDWIAEAKYLGAQRLNELTPQEPQEY